MKIKCKNFTKMLFFSGLEYETMLFVESGILLLFGVVLRRVSKITLIALSLFDFNVNLYHWLNWVNDAGAADPDLQPLTQEHKYTCTPSSLCPQRRHRLKCALNHLTSSESVLSLLNQH